MRTEGTIRNWNDDRGFGFVVTTETKQDVFVHISSFPQTGRRPQAGERLAFSIETDHDGKKRAVAVSYLDPPSAAALAAMRTAERQAPTPAVRPANAAARQTRRPRHAERHARSGERSSGRIGGLVMLLAAVGAGAAIFQRDAIENMLPTSAQPASISATPSTAMPATAWSSPEPASASYATAPTTPAPTATAAPSFSETAGETFRCDGRTHCSHMTSCAEARYFLNNCPNTQMDGNGDGEPCEKQWCH